MSPPFVAKPRTCAQCGTLFSPFSSTARVCSPSCAIKTVKAQKAATKVAVKRRKAELETIPELIKKAQHEFNAYVRERDREKNCISCGTPLGVEAVGGGYDCGHYRSTGSAAHLRFDERNAHGQCKKCNRWGAGRAVDYRIGLVARIGVVAVEALESDTGVVKWDRDTLRQIKAIYRAKARQLRKEQA